MLSYFLFPWLEPIAGVKATPATFRFFDKKTEPSFAMNSEVSKLRNVSFILFSLVVSCLVYSVHVFSGAVD